MIRHGGLVLGVGCLALVFVMLPGQMLGSAFADMRLMPTVLALALIAARPAITMERRLERFPVRWYHLTIQKTRQNKNPERFPDPVRSGNALVVGLAITGLLFAGARLAGNTISMMRYDAAFTADLAALDAIPPNSQLVSLAVEHCDNTYVPWERERRMHFGGYAIARKHDFSNDQWLIPGGQLLGVHNPAAGAFASDPSEVTHAGACRGRPGMINTVARIPPATRYLWLVETGTARHLPGWHPIRFTPGSVVYRRD